MLTLWEAIQQRRSIRKYVSDDVSDEIIKRMLEAARLAPSGSNTQPWRFVVVRDAKVRKELCQIRSGQKFIKEAPVSIVCFADLNRYSKEARKNKWNELTEWGIAETLSGQLAEREYWESRAALPIPLREEMLLNAVSNTFIAIEHLLLMATALGVGTCWLGAIDNDKLNRLFGLPDNIVSVAIITVGYPSDKIPPQRPRLALEEMVLKP